jgi:preprotein translocase subunit SecD
LAAVFLLSSSTACRGAEEVDWVVKRPAEVHVGLDMDLEHYGVTLFFTPQAAQRLHDATEHNLGRQMAVLLNGFVVIAPRIQSLLGPSARISGTYTREAATKLAEQLAP